VIEPIRIFELSLKAGVVNNRLAEGAEQSGAAFANPS
jgi:hypothetical protein